VKGFTWQDGERTIRFGRGCVAGAVDLLGGAGYTLLASERSMAMVPGVVEGAGTVHLVPGGRVDEISAELRKQVTGDRIVGLGGGRVIDTAKAIVAAQGGRAMGVPHHPLGRGDDPRPSAPHRGESPEGALRRGGQRPGA
jgi:hypothetical protein